MSINSLENVTKYSNELDKMFEQKSAVGFFADNARFTRFIPVNKSLLTRVLTRMPCS